MAIGAHGKPISGVATITVSKQTGNSECTRLDWQILNHNNAINILRILANQLIVRSIL